MSERRRFTCPDCGRRFVGRPHTSFTGRELCGDCAGAITAAAAGALTGGPGLEGQVANAISVRGWFQRLRRMRRGG